MAAATARVHGERDDVETRLNRLCGSGLLRRAGAFDEAPGDWGPPADAQETEWAYLIHVYCPHLTAADVTVALTDRVLTIEADRPGDGTSAGVARTASGAGRFTRRFTLPMAVEASQVRAELAGGVLRIHLPKAPAPVAHAIHIAIVQGSLR